MPCHRSPFLHQLGRLPPAALALIALLHRGPAARLVAAAGFARLAAPPAQLLRAVAWTAAALGATDTLAGATTIATSPLSPAAATVGQPFAAVFAVTGAPTPTFSYTIADLPPGLSVIGATSFNGQLLLNASTGAISGIPTAPGTFTASITAWEFTNATGREKSFPFIIVVAAGTAAPPPVIVAGPTSQAAPAGGAALFSVTTEGAGPFTYQWRKDGADLPGATGPTLALASLQPADAGVYAVAVANSAGTTVSAGAILGLITTEKIVGAGTEVGPDIVHPNGNIYDQILITGPAVTVTADPGQVVRASYVDLTDDIVQIEFSGAGALTITLTAATGPALPVNYNQNVLYLRGHATLTLVGADATTNVSAFTVGTATAVNQALFKPGVVYDGVADLARINVASPTGLCGSLRCANTEFSADAGLAGVNAPGVDILGPANVHQVSATANATPVLLTGTIGLGRIGITGGDMFQPNGRPVQVGNAQAIAMLAGETSHKVAQPAQANRAIYVRDGQDVTAQLVIGP